MPWVSWHLVWKMLGVVGGLRPSAACSWWDKVYIVVRGERNSGKGLVQVLIEGVFKPYAGPTDANNFMMCHTNHGDNSKSLAWLVEVKDLRVLYTNEIKMDKSIKMDGNLIKGKLASGATR